MKNETSISFRTTKDIKEKLNLKADKEMRTLSSVINMILSKYFNILNEKLK